MEVKIESQRSDLELFKADMQSQADRKLAQAKGREEERRRSRQKKQQEARLQLKRAIHYLSMKQATSSSPARLEDVLLDSLTLIDDAKRRFERNPPIRFVCIDVEAYEHDQKCITEIGISTLDTDDLIGVSGGVGNAGWADRIISRHFCISEYGHLRNKDFVQGCPANFQFGNSEWIKERDAPAAIKACLAPTPSVSVGNRVPSIVLVAHDIVADVKYLRSLGLEPLELVNDSLDTANLYQALRRQSHSTGLAAVLLYLEIAPKYLHNAGNDARYTLHALLAIAYQSSYGQKSAAAWEDDLESRIQTAIQEAESRVRTEFAGWESHDDDEIMLHNSLQKALHEGVRVKPQGAAKVGNQYPSIRPAQPFGISREIVTSAGNIQSNRSSQGPGSRESEFHVRRGDGVSPSRAIRGLGRGRGRGPGSGNGNANANRTAAAGRGRGRGTGQGHERGMGQGRGRGREQVQDQVFAGYA